MVPLVNHCVSPTRSPIPLYSHATKLLARLDLLVVGQNAQYTSRYIAGRRTRIGTLAGGASESRTYDFSLPNDVLGSYYIIVVTDSSDSVLEVR